MPKKKITKKEKVLSFQDIIMNLQKFWGKYGCVILQPYDIEVGAGTFHPATTLRSLGPKPWKAAYVQGALAVPVLLSSGQANHHSGQR